MYNDKTKSMLNMKHLTLQHTSIATMHTQHTKNLKSCAQFENKTTCRISTVIKNKSNTFCSMTDKTDVGQFNCANTSQAFI